MYAQEFGLDCMHFNPQVYHDLLRCGDGSAEGLVTAFFDVVGVVSAPILPIVLACRSVCPWTIADQQSGGLQAWLLDDLWHDPCT